MGESTLYEAERLLRKYIEERYKGFFVEVSEHTCRGGVTYKMMYINKGVRSNRRLCAVIIVGSDGFAGALDESHSAILPECVHRECRFEPASFPYWLDEVFQREGVKEMLIAA